MAVAGHDMLKPPRGTRGFRWGGLGSGVGTLAVVGVALGAGLALTTALAHQSLLIVFMDARPTFAVRAPYYLP